MNLPTLRCKYQERYAGYSNPEGVGQFYNTAQREKRSYLCVWITGFVIEKWPKLGYRMEDITNTSVPQRSLLKLCSLVIYSTLYKNDNKINQTKRLPKG